MTVHQASQHGTFLVVVTRDDADLFEQIGQQFAGDPATEVIADRRYGERRRRPDARRPDRRCAERRQLRPGQEVPADTPVTIRRRFDYQGLGPGEAPEASGALGDEEGSLQRAVVRLDAALRVARALNALLGQLRRPLLPH